MERGEWRLRVRHMRPTRPLRVRACFAALPPFSRSLLSTSCFNLDVAVPSCPLQDYNLPEDVFKVDYVIMDSKSGAVDNNGWVAAPKPP